ncbi:MAG: FUSC family membrane protein [Opitutus sp.]
MTSLPLWTRFRAWGERESMFPDLGRATRTFFSVTVPLIAAHMGWLPLNLTFVVFAAQSIAIVDVRGAYTLRFGLLLAMALILAGASSLGGAISASVVACVLGAAFVAGCGGLWRHFTPDYGAPLAISSTLLFLLSINSPSATDIFDHHGVSAMAGGLWGVFLQVAGWPIRPQHPLRRAASDSWVAVADLFAALSPDFPGDRSARVRQREAALRTTLDHTYAALASARSAPLRVRLEELNLAAARLATRVVVLNTALESLRSTPEGASFSASSQPMLTSLTNTSRSVAVTVVSRQPGHLANCEVRIQRLGNLIRAVIGQTPADMAASHGGAQLIAILKQVDHNLPHLIETLRATIDRSGERGAFSLQLFELDTWTLRPLASALTDPSCRTFLPFSILLNPRNT